VQRFLKPWEHDAAAVWLVFDPAGRLLGEVEMPAGLEVFEIGEDYVLGLVRDDLDVERLMLHPLTAAGAGVTP